ncbi:MAG: hypothetical protein U9M98_00315 [Patescibacteria group bacterium]|nr:hypothetical protein [Patescibacteria group bacterium]
MKIKKLWREISIFLFSVFLRLPKLGTGIFNADAFRWKARSYNFCSGLFGLDFAQTVQSSHPGVTLMWIGTVGIKVYNAFNSLFRGSLPSGDQQVFELHFVQKFFVVLVFAALFSFAFYLLRRLTNTTIAFFAVLLLTFEPHFLAHTRIFHLDGLLSMFMFVSVLALLCYFEFSGNQNREVSGGDEGQPIPQLRRLNRTAAFPSPRGFCGPSPWGFPCSGFPLLVCLMLSAVFAGLALLTKSTALFLIPFVGLFVLLELFLKRVRPAASLISEVKSAETLEVFPAASLWKEYFLSFGIWILVLAATFTAFWPVMWVQPLKTLQLYYSGITLEGFGGHGNYFFGQRTTDPGPLFYLMSLWIRLSPWLLVLVVYEVFSCTAKTLRSLCQKEKLGVVLKKKGLTVAFSLFVILFYIFISVPSKKLERYSLPLYPALAVLGGVGLYNAKKILVVWLKRFELGFSNLKQVLISRFNVVVALLLFVAFMGSTRGLFPDYLAYRSPLAEGLEGTVGIIQPDWVFGASRVGEFFNSLELEKTPVVYTFNPGQFRLFLPGYVRDTQDVEGLSTADFIILPVWSERNLEIDPELFDLVEVIEVNNTPVYNIYQAR